MKVNDKVFLFENDLFYIEIIKHLLRQEGFIEVWGFEDCDECLTQANKTPRLILIDHSLDAINNYKVTNYFQSHFPKTTIIMISSMEITALKSEYPTNNSFHLINKNSDLRTSLIAVLKQVKGQ